MRSSRLDLVAGSGASGVFGGMANQTPRRRQPTASRDRNNTTVKLIPPNQPGASAPDASMAPGTCVGGATVGWRALRSLTARLQWFPPCGPIVPAVKDWGRLELLPGKPSARVSTHPPLMAMARRTFAVFEQTI